MKVKNIMFSGFMAMVLAGACGAANAQIVVASQKYVDDKVTTLNSKDTELSVKITALEDANKTGGAVADAIAAAQGAADAAQSDVDTLAGKMNLDSADSDLSQALALKEDAANKLDSSQIDLLNTDGTVNKDAVNTLVGNDTKFPTVGAAVEIANAKAQQVLENVNSVSANLGTLTSKVDEHTASIEILEGGEGVTGSVANQVKAEADRATQAEAGLAQAIADEKSRAEAAEQGLQTAINAINNGETGALATAKGYADEKVAAEKERAEAAEQANAQAILDAKTELKGYADAAESDAVTTANAYTDSQVSTLTSQTANNTGAIAQLRTDVNAAGVAIDDIAKEGGTIDQKVSALETKLMDDTNGTVTAAVAAEKTRAEGKEAELATAISNEKTRAEGEETRIEGLVTAEKERAMGVEEGLQNSINAINNDTNGIYAKAKQYTDAGLNTIYSNASECIADSDSNNCILSARTGTDGNPMYVWISLTAPAE